MAGRPEQVTRMVNQLAKERGVTPQTIRNNLKDNKFGQWKWADNQHTTVQLRHDYMEYFKERKWENVKVKYKEKEDKHTGRDYENYFYVDKYSSKASARADAEERAKQELDDDAEWTQGLKADELEEALENRIRMYTVENLDAVKRIPKEGAEPGAIGQANTLIPEFRRVAKKLSEDDREYFVDTVYDYIRMLIADKDTVPNKFQRQQVMNLVLNEISLMRKQTALYKIRDKSDDDLKDDIDKLIKWRDSIASGLGWVRRKGDFSMPGSSDNGEKETGAPSYWDNEDMEGEMY